ncbi:hypothetical protein F5Y01DRAFT_312616 [Xylaria sp. FL0043]|nr:hypothetical protein F5Y01DRAFT_312616 [Xylaria sp. FL0043]
MADQKSRKWTEEDKNQFLLQVIGLYMATGTKISVASSVSLPGRTQKALELFWDKIRKEAQAAVAAAGDPSASVPATPSKPATPAAKSTPASRKRTAKAADLTNGDGDGDGDSQGKSSTTLPPPSLTSTSILQYNKRLCTNTFIPATPTKRSRTPAKPRGKAKSAPTAPAIAVEEDHDEGNDEAAQELVDFDMHRFDNEFFYGPGHV